MDEVSSLTVLERAFLAQRPALLRFLVARGAGEAAEDLVQDLWLKIAAAPPAQPVEAPAAYFLRAANRLMIDRFRSTTQAAARERAWSETQPGGRSGISAAPAADRVIAGREHARLVQQALDALGPRVAAIFRRHRIDEVPQRQIAEEFTVSLSTVEADLRRAYRALAELKERIDEA